MKQKVMLSVVTVTYKPDVTELKLFIDSFYRYNDLGTGAHLVIVDNSPMGSWDTSVVLAEFPNITLIPNPSNPGFGASNNLGFEYYQSEYVLFINNDVEFLEPVFKKIITEFEKDQTIGCIGIHQEGGAPSFFPKMTCPKGINATTFNDKFHFISGSFMFFKSSAFIECGKFDTQLFMYFEEFDVSERLIKKGFQTRYMPTLSFLHKVGNRRTVSETTWKKAVPSFCYICKKYNLDPKFYSQGIMRRLRLLFVYNLILLRFNEALKALRVYRYRKSLIYKEFGVRI